MCFLTIGIPTYNRKEDLEKNLETIYAQIGSDEDIEVLISDNASNDGTQEVVAKYLEAYSNLVYIRNDINIGMGKNIRQVIDKSNGAYCMLHGDDDMYTPYAIEKIIDFIKKDLDCAIYFFYYLSNDKKWQVSEGMDKFLEEISYAATAVSRIIVNKEIYRQIKDKEAFSDSFIPHIYIMYLLLTINERYMTFSEDILIQSAAATSTYNYGEVFMGDYFKMLSYFSQYGLSEKHIAEEKHKILVDFIIPYYQERQKTPVAIDMHDVIPYYIKNYKEEPYFEKYYKILCKIQKGYTW